MENIENKIEYLSGFVLPERLERLESRLEDRTRYAVMCLEDIFYPHNASAVIRSAEAFGLQEMHAVESLTKFKPSSHIVRGTDQWIELGHWQSSEELVMSLKGRGYRIVITSPREGGYTPETFPVEQGPFALFMGTEKTGISSWLTDQADDAIYIPMCGFAESLNISVSAAIILQRLTERIRQNPTIEWQLGHHEKQTILLEWLMRSVRDSQRILDNKFNQSQK